MPRRPRLLLVEDDPFVREVLEAALGEVYALSVARDVAGALARMAARRPDLVLADWLPPDCVFR